jgi:hypothetical protein
VKCLGFRQSRCWWGVLLEIFPLYCARVGQKHCHTDATQTDAIDNNNSLDTHNGCDSKRTTATRQLHRGRRRSSCHAPPSRLGPGGWSSSRPGESRGGFAYTRPQAKIRAIHFQFASRFILLINMTFCTEPTDENVLKFMTIFQFNFHSFMQMFGTAEART